MKAVSCSGCCCLDRRRVQSQVRGSGRQSRELCTAMSMARHRRDQGKRDKARDLLRNLPPVYTLNLKEANARGRCLVQQEGAA